jgi:NADPH:quinone reductase-like Zn-dependent oxidoreductase
VLVGTYVHAREKNMRAVYFGSFGGCEVLQYGDRPKPVPGQNQVLIEVEAAGVNPADKRIRSGDHQEFFKSTFPVVSGWDVSGRIAEIGPGVNGWNVGDEVVGLGFTYNPQHGSYAEYMPIDSSAIARKPPELSFVEGAALPLTSLTAWQSLTEIAAVQPGDSVFVSAGAGGLGSTTIALAKFLQANVYTTTRGANFDYVRSLGADFPIDYTQTSYTKELLAQEPDGVNVVLELLDCSEDSISICRSGGVAVFMNGYPPDSRDAVDRSIKTEWIHHRPDGAMLHQLMNLYSSGSVPMPSITVLDLEEARAAHREIETGHTRGKIVLQVKRAS